MSLLAASACYSQICSPGADFCKHAGTPAHISSPKVWPRPSALRPIIVLASSFLFVAGRDPRASLAPFTGKTPPPTGCSVTPNRRPGARSREKAGKRSAWTSGAESAPALLLPERLWLTSVSGRPPGGGEWAGCGHRNAWLIHRLLQPGPARSASGQGQLRRGQSAALESSNPICLRDWKATTKIGTD